jgi:TusA-related sulfurtransferase
MPETIELDVRGLEAPEPLVRVLSALDRLAPGASLVVRIDRLPIPLYRALELSGYSYEERAGKEAPFEITIRRR